MGLFSSKCTECGKKEGYCMQVEKKKWLCINCLLKTTPEEYKVYREFQNKILEKEYRKTMALYLGSSIIGLVIIINSIGHILESRFANPIADSIELLTVLIWFYLFYMISKNISAIRKNRAERKRREKIN